MSKRKNVIFNKRLSRLDVFKTLILSITNYILLYISKSHINNGRRQMVVFSFDYIAIQINLYGTYEIEQLDTFFEWLKLFSPNILNGLAIDIGANIGNHSLYFSKFFDKVYSFEPNPLTFKVLNLNSELVNNIACFNFGISNSHRVALLSVNPLNIGGSFIADNQKKDTENIILKTLDSVILDSENVNLIKIDIEGHEFKALEGARNIIIKNHPVILFEQNLSDFEGNKSKVVELLKEYGYSQFVTITKTPRALNRLNLIFRWGYAFLGRFIMGTKMQIKIDNNLEPGFYNFIAAIPDSIKLTKYP
jgi:FkbM family methyltransferase